MVHGWDHGGGILATSDREQLQQQIMEMPLHSPLNSRWDRSNTELVSVWQKFGTTQRLGEDIGNLILARNLSKIDDPACNLFMDEVNINFNVLCSMMKHLVLGNVESTLITTM